MRIFGALIAALFVVGCSSETPSGGDKAEAEKPAAETRTSSASAEQDTTTASDTAGADNTAATASDASAADPAPVAADATPAAASSKIKAVLMYADWCGSCKVLDPKLKAVQAKGTIEGVDYVVLDFTEKNADALFAAADAKGVGPTIRARFPEQVKTGLLLLVDTDSGEIVKEISKTMTEDEIEAALKESAAAA